MSEELKPCPCGKVPENLVIEEGATDKYTYASGGCCGEWRVGFRSGYYRINEEDAIEAWNGAKRKEMEKDEEKEMSEAVIRQLMKGEQQ